MTAHEQRLNGNSVVDVDRSMIVSRKQHDASSELVSLDIRKMRVGVVAQIEMDIGAANADGFDRDQGIFGTHQRLWPVDELQLAGRHRHQALHPGFIS
jgi:hypothetical protein